MNRRPVQGVLQFHPQWKMNESGISFFPHETMCSSLKLLNVMSHFLFSSSRSFSLQCFLAVLRVVQAGAHITAPVYFSPCIMKALCFVLSGSKDVIVSHKTCLNSGRTLARTRISFSRRSSLCCTGRYRVCLTKLLLSSPSPSQLARDLCLYVFV